MCEGSKAHMVELTVHTGLHSREKERAGDCRADQCAIVAIRASVRVHVRGDVLCACRR